MGLTAIERESPLFRDQRTRYSLRART
ncbi:uncharacterized protein G2W53_011623 [Senna tora]|uniref:Uncharacterized protein n=1 Tax=Senna tora TaxID=362788 RepID=A0A834X2H8_9FABA|nr:uncharacterized protein G2W53_011623 [Senna tora]